MTEVAATIESIPNSKKSSKTSAVQRSTQYVFVMISLVKFGKVLAVVVVAYTLLFTNDFCLATDDIPNYIRNENIINGFIFPSKIDAVVGEEIYLKIVYPVANQDECLYRKSGGEDVNVLQPHKEK